MTGPTTAPPALEAVALSRSFGEDRAVDGLDLDVVAGEVHAIVGLNGAGKTTLMRLWLGMLRPDAGLARVLGVDAQRATSSAWAQVGHLIEVPALWPELTVRDHLVAAARLHRSPASTEAVGAILDRFELGRWSDRRARELSLGNRQRVGLARALLHRPAVVLLDEPANGLDPAGVVVVRDVLAAEAARGTAVLVSSHHLDEIARIADRITVLHRGHVAGRVDPGGVDLERRFFDLVHEDDRQRSVRARA